MRIVAAWSSTFSLLRDRLRDLGVLAKPIRPPTVPAGTSRLRFALTAAHTAEHIDRALAALRAC